MEVKVFEAHSMKDAIKQVKDTFGSDAVILETKQKMDQSQRTKIFEITAAPGKNKQNTPKYGASAAAKDSSLINSSDLIAWQRRMDKFEEKIESIYEKALKREHLIAIESSMEELRTLIVDYLSRKSDSVFRGVSEPISNIIKRLKVMNVNDGSISHIVKYLKSLPETTEKNEDIFEYYQRHSIRWFMKRIRIGQPWHQMDGETQVHVVMGPTGVGKSSMVAKLASYYTKKERKKTLIVSYDNHRLGSTEQMRLSAKVLDIPFVKMNHASELETIIDQYSNMDLILVDTGGRSPKLQESIDELLLLKNIDSSISFHLSLSMTDQRSHMERVIRNFSKLGINSLLFTKMDESWSFGEVYNAMDRWGIALSWFGIGDRIPEDLEKATRERIIERIIGL